MGRPKIAMIGAGSVIFCKTLANDILATPSLQASELRLMSRTRPKLDKTADRRSRSFKPLARSGAVRHP